MQRGGRSSSGEAGKRGGTGFLGVGAGGAEDGGGGVDGVRPVGVGADGVVGGAAARGGKGESALLRKRAAERGGEGEGAPRFTWGGEDIGSNIGQMLLQPYNHGSSKRSRFRF